MEFGRRDFLKMAGLIGIGVSVKPVLDVLSPAEVSKDLSAAGTHAPEDLAMVVDLKACVENCNECVEACHREHNVPEIDNFKHEVKWIWRNRFEGAFPEQAHEFAEEYLSHMTVPVLCNHCTNAPCARVCPTGATWKREDGIVMMDYHRCIGCRFCMAACPYGARSFNWKDPQPLVADKTPGYPTRTKGVVEKCNFCADTVPKGQIPVPHCVAACKKDKEEGKEALFFGDLGDPNSRVRELLSSRYAIRRRPGLGTQPNVYYLV